jgi:hypothetical protein
MFHSPFSSQLLLTVVIQSMGTESDGDDFEVVPQDQSDDDTMWDVEDDDEDEVKREKIKSKKRLSAPDVLHLTTRSLQIKALQVLRLSPLLKCL